MIVRLPSMGFPGAYGIVFPVAVFRIAVTLMWIKQVCVSIMNFLLGRGWASPSVRIVSNFPLYWAESEAQEATYGIICALNAGMLAAEISASIPVVRFGDMSNNKLPSSDEEEEPECSVCLCDFTAEDNVRQTPRCSHVFHKDCLDRWTAHHQTSCPLCRSSLSPKWLEQEDTQTTTGRSSFGSSSRFRTTDFSHFADQVVQLALRRDAAGMAITTT